MATVNISYLGLLSLQRWGQLDSTSSLGSKQAVVALYIVYGPATSMHIYFVLASVRSPLNDIYCTLLLGPIITGDCDISLHSWVEEGERQGQYIVGAALLHHRSTS